MYRGYTVKTYSQGQKIPVVVEVKIKNFLFILIWIKNNIVFKLNNNKKDNSQP